METEEEKKKREEEERSRRFKEFFSRKFGTDTNKPPAEFTYRSTAQPEPEPEPAKPESKIKEVAKTLFEDVKGRAEEAALMTLEEGRIDNLKGRARLFKNLAKQIPKDMAAGYANQAIGAVGRLLEKPATKGVRYIAEKITGKPSKLEVKIGTTPVYGGGQMSPDTFRSKMEYETEEQRNRERLREKIFNEGRMK